MSGNGTALQTKPDKALATRTDGPRSELEALLLSRRNAIADVIPKHLTPERLIKIACLAVSKSPLLKQCDTRSLVECVVTASTLGLDCGGTLGSAYLVPFRGKDGRYAAQLIIGYRGMIDLARRSGNIDAIEARVVYQNDQFDVEYTPEGVQLKHRPAIEGEPGPLRLVYGIARLKDGGTQFEMMTRAQIDRIRARSKSGNNGPWVTDYDEMARKTVVRRLFKYLPTSVDLVEAMSHESDDTVIEGELVETPAAKLNKQLVQTMADRARPEIEEREPFEAPFGPAAESESAHEAPSDTSDGSDRTMQAGAQRPAAESRSAERPSDAGPSGLQDVPASDGPAAGQEGVTYTDASPQASGWHSFESEAVKILTQVHGMEATEAARYVGQLKLSVKDITSAQTKHRATRAEKLNDLLQYGELR